MSGETVTVHHIGSVAREKKRKLSSEFSAAKPKSFRVLRKGEASSVATPESKRLNEIERRQRVLLDEMEVIAEKMEKRP